MKLFNVMKSFLQVYMKILEVASLEDKDKNLRLIDSGHSRLDLYSCNHWK